jgi:F0F1-type ATP synthase assembly protein I
MSLKAFHLVFITAATLLAFGFGIWLAKNFFSTGGAGNLISALLSFGAGIGLIVYECYFLKKTKDVGYL